VHVLVGDPFPVPHGGGKTAVTAATEAIRTHLAALVVTLDGQIASGAAAKAMT
jgi:hypothetical protein